MQTGQSASNGFTWAFFKVDRSRVSETSQSDGPNRRTAKLARVEAVLFVADGAVSHRRLAQLATLADAAEAQRLVERLNELYDASASAFRVERMATGYQLMTRSEFSFWLDKLHHRQSSLKLSAPAIETLAMVAYRQPITRADVEAIRGVQSTEMLKQLMERGLVRISGHEESLGRPYLYATTAKFLELHGLRMLDDLPMSDLRRRPQTEDHKLAAKPVDDEPSDDDEATTTEQIDEEEVNEEEVNEGQSSDAA
jgi:segregation and condensation protein B